MRRVVAGDLGVVLRGFGVTGAVHFGCCEMVGRCLLQVFACMLVVLLQRRVSSGIVGFSGIQGHGLLSGWVELARMQVFDHLRRHPLCEPTTGLCGATP